MPEPTTLLPALVVGACSLVGSSSPSWPTRPMHSTVAPGSPRVRGPMTRQHMRARRT